MSESADQNECLAFERAVKLKLAEGDGWFDFDGSTCEQKCGWDGEDNRCCCGNNRVCWTYDSTLADKERPQDYIYGTTW